MASHQSNGTLNETYEYIVIGSGPGGGPLAANLSRQGHSVLLLEAGDDQGQNPNEKIPLFFAAASEDATMRWDYFVSHYTSEKQAARDPKMTWETPDGSIFVGLNPPKGSKQKGIYYPRAGTLGGCAAHNALVAIVPHDEDWRHIAEVTGDKSWEPENMRKFFDKLERCQYLPDGIPGHGFNGWLETEHPDPVILESVDAFLTAAQTSIGRKGLIPDINAIHPQRVDGLYEVTLQMSKSGRRSSPRNFLVATANARREDGSKKYPLHIRTHSLATKILFSEQKGEYPEAIGVEFREGPSLYKADPRFDPKRLGTMKRVMASREVIVAAGVFNTPQLLKLSGVGPAAELKRFHIPVVVDLPGVGTNLQDNYEFSVVAQSPENFSPFKKSTLLDAGDPLLKQWIDGHGAYKSDGLAAAVLKHSTVSGGDEDLFLFGGPLNFPGFFPGYSRTAFGSLNDFTWDVLKVHPRNNAGTVDLKSKDPLDVPEINFRFFEENNNGKNSFNDAEHDLEAMAEGVALARDIFARIQGPIGPLTEQSPGTSVNTKMEIKQAIKDQAFSHHATSTCAIGANDDVMACLDSKFRVKGTKGLRVVDASIFPRVPGPFPTVPIYMVSEKAAGVILEEVRGEDMVLDGVKDDEVLIQEWADKGDGVLKKKRKFESFINV